MLHADIHVHARGDWGEDEQEKKVYKKRLDKLPYYYTQ